MSPGTANSFFPIPDARIDFGDPDGAFENADFVESGTVRMGAQEHFYMETNCCMAVPSSEHGEMEIHTSSQDATIIQVWLSTESIFWDETIALNLSQRQPGQDV